ncbi:MAG: rhomboid family intramembrane serine protease [Chthoniobacterales bacterium]|nr:rhomboid family intramembrane serine protease [Chthoniobacterales bacterium]
MTNRRTITDLLFRLLDLNHILLFIALASPLILLWRMARMRRTRPRGWIAAATIVLLVSGFGWLLAPAIAGYIGGSAWALLLLLPSLTERKISGLVLERRYRAAYRLTLVRRIFHPWYGAGNLPSSLGALELARAGNLVAALDQLATARTKTPGAEVATAYTYALTENWRGLAEWCRRDLKVTADPVVRALYLRALGETGAVEELAWSFAGRAPMLEQRFELSPQSAQELLYLLAFAGKVGAVVRLLQSTLARFPRAHQEFWIATAELTAGKTDAATSRLTSLRNQTGDAILEKAIAARLARAETFPHAQLAPATEKLVSRLLEERSGGWSGQMPLRTRRPVAVWGFVFLNLAMFGAELALGGATNEPTLHRLGALEPAVVLQGHEYWRLVSALFLHYGFLHLFVNLYALYLLGPALERVIGSIPFAAGYLISGLGSSGGVVLLRALGLTREDQLVGASGCVMGVIGISAGLLLRHRQTPLAGRRLREILGIVAFQTIFDLLTPQVSLVAHLSGFFTGVLVGLLLAQHSPPALTL